MQTNVVGVPPDVVQEGEYSVPYAPVSTKRSLSYVYGGYFFRYVYLLILIPYYGRVLGAAEYGKVLVAMSLFGSIWLVVNYGFSLVGGRDIASTTSLSVIGGEFGRHIIARLLMSVVGIIMGVVGTALSHILWSEPMYGLLATVLGLMSAFNLGWYFQG